ncbi:hypothetical protein [Roseateles sp.]|uniref:hypothetical protein n=1 Tax=Roseateles sp. TaxID=1971397 RepID=UPI003BAA28F3
MEWVPIVLGTFKALVFGTGMFFAIKWHHDQAKKKKQADAANRPGPDTAHETDAQTR